MNGNAPITGWTASDPSLAGLNPGGISTPLAFSPFADNGTIPHGSRVAFIRAFDGGTTSLSTVITGLTAGTWYRVQFRANRKTDGGAPILACRINGDLVANTEVHPSAGSGVGEAGDYYSYHAIFRATATTAPLEFSCTSWPAEEATLLLDDLKITTAVNLTVTSQADDGPGSLRATVLAATQGTNADKLNVITFAAALNGKTVTLNDQIEIFDSGGLAVDASSLPSGITLVTSASTFRHFFNPFGSVTAFRKLTLKNSTFEIPTLGGGSILNHGDLHLTLCRFENNRASDMGGAIFNASRALLTATDCLFSGNETDASAGAVHHEGFHLSIRGCTFLNNHADFISGGVVLGGATPTVISASTFQGNTATTTAGAIYVADSCVLRLEHCTVAGNTATDGGGIINFGTTTVKNCIIADNTATSNPASSDVDNSGEGDGVATFTREGANIIEAFANTGGTPGVDQGPAALTSNPLLAAINDNGGPTPTRALLAASPAVNAAVDSTTTVDQRGLPMLLGADLGAYELQGGGKFTFSLASSMVLEGTLLSVGIQRQDTNVGPATVRVYTMTGTAGAADFTARPNTAASDVTFANGESAKIIYIPISSDVLSEAAESFTVKLGPAVAPATLGAITTTTITINNAPGTLLVTSTADTNTPGTLRAALAAAAGTPGVNTITFAPSMKGATITLGDEFVIADPGGVVIDAQSIGGITLSGADASRHFTVEDGASLTLKRVTLIFGDGTGATDPGFGGSILSRSGATVRLEDCTLRANSATDSGGAIHHVASATAGSLTAHRCTFFLNEAEHGGAVWSDAPPADVVHFTEFILCTFSGNKATGMGGAVLNTQGITMMTHCTIANNQASEGTTGGVASDADGDTETMVINCIITGNFGGDVGLIEDPSPNSYTSLGGNVIGSGDANGAFSQPTDIINVMAGLSQLRDNGGPTVTHGLTPDHPARNRGIGAATTTDQRGYPLVGAADSGAYESQAGGRFYVEVLTGTVAEGSPASVRVVRTDDFVGPATVRLYTSGGTAAATDYTGRANTAASDVTFADGDTSKTVLIPTTADALAEKTETFIVALGSPTPVPIAAVVSPASATVSIADPLIVTTLNDDGPGSLRQALATAAANATPDIITFAPALSGKVITLASQILVVDGPGVIVDASNLAAGITIDAGPGENRIFQVGAGGVMSMTLRGFTLSGGHDDVAGGGAIYNENNATFTLERCTLSGNRTVTAPGGAINNYGSMVLTQCTFSGNSTTTAPGGAINNYGTMVLAQCTLSGNSTLGVGVAGGAILNAGTLTLTHCTVAGNTTDGSGGGIFSFGAVTLDRCIVASNSSPDIYLMLSSASLTLQGISIVPELQNNSGTVFNPGNQDPSPALLDPLASNGGPTKTRAPQSGSPAIDAGAGSTITRDQRGLPLVGAADLGAFEVQPGGTFALSHTGYTCEETNGATVRILRQGGTQGQARVRLITANGTAMAGDSMDYDARPNTTDSDVYFDDGEAFKDVVVTTNGGGGDEFNESFTVSLTMPSPGTAIGTPASASISIQDPSAGSTATDDVDPTLTISAPKQGSSLGVNVGGTVTVTGTATDNKGIQHVSVKLNGVVQGTATLDLPNAKSTGYRIDVDPARVAAGANKVEVTATDGAGNETATAVFVTFKVLRPLVVNVAGNGSVTTGYAPSSYREVGAPQTITAAAGEGSLFAGWEVLSSHLKAHLGVTDLSLEKKTLTFIHREGLILRAKFVPNPYTPEYTGVYNGPVTASTPTARRLDTEGYLTATVLGTGGFSGTLKIDGLSLPLAGTFDHLGDARFGTNRVRTLSIARTDKPSYSLTLRLDRPTKRLLGTLTQVDGTVTDTSAVVAWRAHYSAANPVPDTLVGPLTPNVRYTVFFMPDEVGQQPAGYTVPQFPFGYGHGWATVSTTGVISFTGTLPDGAAVTMSTTLADTSAFRLFVQLYGGKGVLANDMIFDDGSTDLHLTGFDGVWIKPTLDAQHYPLGWPDGLSIDTTGTRQIIPPGQNTLKDDPAGLATITFSNGVSPDIVGTATISATDVVTSITPGMTLTIDRSKSTFSGTVTLPGNTKVNYTGAIKNKTVGQAFGYFLTPTPAVKDYLGSSWRVTLAP